MTPSSSQARAVRVELPWPPKDVSPNARGHWTKLHRAKRAYGHACGWECHAQNVKPMSAEAIKATITFRAPDRRARDIDNMLASIKAGIDAVAETIGIDDSKWSITIARGETLPKRGAVVMELEAA